MWLPFLMCQNTLLSKIYGAWIASSSSKLINSSHDAISGRCLSTESETTLLTEADLYELWGPLRPNISTASMQLPWLTTAASLTTSDRISTSKQVIQPCVQFLQGNKTGQAWLDHSEKLLTYVTLASVAKRLTWSHETRQYLYCNFLQQTKAQGMKKLK